MSEKNPFPDEDNTGHVWDDNLRELKNPPPRWWMIGFWASIAFIIGYGILYPMWPLASDHTKGILGWTQIQEYKEGVAEIESVRAEFEEKLKTMSADEILKDEGLADYTVASAKVLFGDNCAPCHGNGGAGNPGYPILADDDWLWGGSIAKIRESIINGRGKGAIIPAVGMPAHKGVLSDGEIDTLANYVVALSEGKTNESGKKLFMVKGCIGCHGLDGKGMAVLGSANLTDPIWRFEPSGVESARYTIEHGVNAANDPATRDAQMPAFKERLDNTTINKLAVYVYKFGGGK